MTRESAQVSLSPIQSWWVAVILVAIPTTAGTARGLVIPGLRLSEVLTLVLGAWCVIRFGSRMKVSGPFLGTVYCFVLISVVAGLFTAVKRPELPASFVVQDSIGVLQYLVLFIVAFNLAGLPALMEKFVVVLIWTGGAMGLVAVVQLSGFQPSLELATYVTGNPLIAHPESWKAPRSTGLFFAWHALGGYLALILVLGIAVMANPVGSVRPRRRLWLPLGGVLAGLLTTLTFAPIAIGLGGAAIVAIYRRKPYHLLVAGFMCLLAVFLTPVGRELDGRVIAQSTDGGEIPQTIAYRINVWERDFIPLISHHLWTGYGPTVGADRVFAYPESMYIAVLLRGGILLLFALVALCVFGMAVAIRGSKICSPHWTTPRAVATAMMAVVPLLVCAMVIHPYLVDAGVSQLFFIYLGISAAAMVASRTVGSSSDG